MIVGGRWTGDPSAGPNWRELHQEIALLLEADPSLIARASEAVAEATEGDRHARQKWARLLERPQAKIVLALTRPSDKDRPSPSPFLFALSTRQRRHVLAGAGARAKLRHAGEYVDSRRRHFRSKDESKLSDLRIRAGLSQAEMVERTGIPSTTYWRLERKRIPNPQVGHLAACARVFGVPLEDVIEPEYLEWRPREKQPRSSP